MKAVCGWTLAVLLAVGASQAQAECSEQQLAGLKKDGATQQMIDLMCHGKFTMPEFLAPGATSVKTGVIDAPVGGNTIAPLTVVAPKSSHIYIKLVDTQSDAVVLTGLIRSSERLEMRVPLGSFRLRYAAGLDWYGKDKLFGNSTEYAEAGTTLEFKAAADGRVTSYEIELVAQKEGNLRNKGLKASDF